MDDIFVYYHEFPDGINEAVMTCSGGYTVYIDPRQSNEGIINSYKHALKHIYGVGFEHMDVQEIESKAQCDYKNGSWPGSIHSDPDTCRKGFGIPE